ASLTMDDIPTATLNDGIHLRRNVVVTLRWPGRHPNDMHPLDHLFFGKKSSKGVRSSCKNCDTDSFSGETASDFMDMCFHTTCVRKVTWSYQQYIERTCLACHRSHPFLCYLLIRQQL